VNVTIIVQLPTGEHDQRVIDEQTVRLGWFYIPLRVGFFGAELPAQYSPLRRLVAKPTDQWFYSLSPTGVSAIQVWSTAEV